MFLFPNAYLGGGNSARGGPKLCATPWPLKRNQLSTSLAPKLKPQKVERFAIYFVDGI